jgi:DNA-binding HxlR family transcriptional regulator
VPKRSYGQYCGFARALEALGERWALMLVRDLLVGPRRFTDLRHGMPGIPTNILSARLKELEAAGVVRRRVLPRPDGSVVYELTPYGQELEEIVVALGRWGAKSLAQPRSGETVTPNSLIMALRTTFRPERAVGLTCGYELRSGDLVLHARIRDGVLSAGAGPLPDADLVIETGPALRALMAHELSPAEAIENGSVRLQGDRALLDTFVELFRIDPLPAHAGAA